MGSEMCIRDSARRVVEAFSLHDTGASKSYCSSRFAKRHATSIVSLQRRFTAKSINGTTVITHAANFDIETKEGISQNWFFVLSNINQCYYRNKLLVPQTILEKYDLGKDYFNRETTRDCDLIIGADNSYRLMPREKERCEGVILYESLTSGRLLITGAPDRLSTINSAAHLNMIRDNGVETLSRD